MHRSFGMECRPRSMRWDGLKVRRHVGKLANYATLMPTRGTARTRPAK